MELLLIPAFFLTGFVLLVLSASGMQSAKIAYGPAPQAQSVRTALRRSWFSHGSHQPAPAPQPKPQTSESDVLLADLMTEMIAFREQLATLREEVKALSQASKPVEAEAKPRRTRRAPAA